MGETMKPLQLPESIDIHHNQFKLEKSRLLLEKENILESNKQHINRFLDYCITNPKINYSTILKYCYVMRIIGKISDKDFRNMDENDINTLLVKIQGLKTVKGRPYSEQSARDFRKTISRFWRWLYIKEYKGRAPPPIENFHVCRISSNKEPEIFTREEIKKIINGAANHRDKAFFHCLYDLGCRVSELLSRQIKHIRYNEEGDIQILIEAEKTRKVHWETLFESAADFTTWLRIHPLNSTPNAPLWPLMKNFGIKPMSYALTRKIFLKIINKQNIRPGMKSIIHMLRKTKATHDMEDNVPIPFIESRGSWSKGSEALQKCYISIHNKNKDNAYKKKYNMKLSETKAQQNTLTECKRCAAKLEEGTKFCFRCGFPTDKSTIQKIQQANQQVTSLIDKDMLSEMVKKIVMESIEK